VIASALVAAAEVIVPPLLPTMVSGEFTAMLAEPAAKAPLTATTGLAPVLASPTPFSRLHTGACAVPALLSLHVAVPSAPTYTVSASVAQWPSVIHTLGPTPEHSLSAEHLRQAFVVVAQIGVVPEHVLLSVHWTQAPVAAQAVCPANVEQSLVFVQPRQVLVAVAQIGVEPEQVAFVRHCTHVLIVTLQTLVVPPHLVALVAVHCTQAPPAAQATRAGSFRPAQSGSVAHAWHFSLIPQIGVAPVQLAEVMHWTQVFVVMSQAGVVPMHDVLAVVAVHCTHCPSERHAARVGFLVWHCKSTAQPTQMFLVVSQIGVAGVAQWLLAVQPTHLPVSESQTLVGAVQKFAPPSRPDWQPTQTPATQNDFAGSGQSLFTPQVPAASGTRVSIATSGTR
jgi:hypothetical protein